MIKDYQYQMSGSIKICVNNDRKFKLEFDKKKVVIDVLLLSNITHYNFNFRISRRLKNIKKLMNILAEYGLTLRNNTEVAILGKEAKPKFSKYITNTKYIEIRNLKELRKLNKLLLNMNF
jgi:hypothetical protein